MNFPWPSPKKLLFWTLLGWAPFLSLLVGASVAWAFHCQVDEGSTHPCIAFGLDVGDLVYDLCVTGWLIIPALPVMLGTLVLWLALLARLIVRRILPKPAGGLDISDPAQKIPRL